MSVEPQDQFVFGSHVASPTSSASARTLTWMSEVAADDELAALCRTAADAMPPAARTAVVLVGLRPPPAAVEGLTPAAVATSSPSTTAVMKIEWLLREGPVRTSLESGETTVSHRLGADGRWPRFARAVAAHDTVSAVAVPVPLQADTGRGVLAAYSQDEGAFDPRDLRVLAAFARIVADAVVRERREAAARELEEPETTRLVNQAVGVLITHHCDEEQALRRLRKISALTHQPIAAAARMIVDEAQTEARLRFVVGSPPQQVRPR